MSNVLATNYYCLSNWTDIYSPDEENDNEEITDDSGYIDKNQYIAQMLESGQALDQIRDGTYEYDDESETEAQIDPFRAGWTDPSDIDRVAMGLQTKYGDQQVNTGVQNETTAPSSSTNASSSTSGSTAPSTTNNTPASTPSSSS